MNKNTLPKILVILFFVVFLGTLSFFVYQRYQSGNLSSSKPTEEPSVQKNIEGLKNSNKVISSLTFNGINKETETLSVIGNGFNQNTVQEYPIDSGAILICLESEEYLRNKLNFSQLNVWDSGAYSRILSYEADFFERNTGRPINLILLSKTDVVVGMVVGGCK